MITPTYRAAALALCWILAQPALAGGFDRERYEQWVTMRVGDGEPVYWYSHGTIRAYPGGKLIATIEGYDTARLDVDSTTADKAVQLSRKTYIYRDAETGEIMRNPDGSTVAPIAYPYQLITYELKGDTLETWVEQGKGDKMRRIGPGGDMKAQVLEAGTLFTAPLYLDFETPRGRYQTFENYDFFAPGGNPRDGFILFIRYGDAPAWAEGTDKIVMHMTTERFESLDAVPESFRAWVSDNAPLWLQPPADMDEIENLQAASDD
ncbi:MAG: hypothetical protein AAGA41_10980 [Pseudomonadota bacterium]